MSRRITPACAGKTYKVTGLERGKRDHPRVCGKNKAKYILGIKYLGSPPRVREKPLKTSTVYLKGGITPACAGKTQFP